MPHRQAKSVSRPPFRNGYASLRLTAARGRGRLHILRPPSRRPRGSSPARWHPTIPTRRLLMRLRSPLFSRRFAAIAVLLAVVGVVPWLPAAEDAAAPGLVATLKGHTRGRLRRRLHAGRQVRRHRQRRSQRQGVGRRHRQGDQELRRADRPSEPRPQRVRQRRRRPDRFGRLRQQGQALGLPQLQPAARHRQERRRRRPRRQPRRHEARRRR